MSSITWQVHRSQNADVTAYLALSAQQWPKYPDQPIDPKWWRTPFAWVVGRDESGEVVGGCEWIRRFIRVGNEDHAIAALASVVVSPEKRGNSFGGELVNFATAFVTSEGYEWAVLFTGHDRRSFYERLGYSKLSGEILVTRFDIRGTVEADAVIMAKALIPRVVTHWPFWKTATIDVGHGTW